MNNREFWSTAGIAKNFSDPFYEEKFSAMLNQGSTIVEWLEQQEGVTMNGNGVRTFHLIAQK